MDDELEKELDKELEDMIAEANAERDGDDDGDDSDKDEDIDTDKDSDLDDDKDENLDDDSKDLDKDEEDENLDDNDDNKDDDKDSDDSEKFEELVYNHGDTEIKITSKEELLAYAKKGVEQNKSIREKSNVELIAEQGDLSHDDMMLIINAKKGDKNALAKIAELGNVDLLDVENEDANSYKNEFQVETVSEVDTAINEILSDSVHSENFATFAKQVPESFSELLLKDAGVLRAFSTHVKTGLAAKVIPEAIKATQLTGGNFIDNYASIGRRVAAEMKASTTETKEVKKSDDSREVSDREQKLRERASHDSKEKGGKKTGLSVDDIWNMSNEEFDNTDFSKVR